MNERVLVVDDEVEMLDVLGYSLEQHGYQVVKARSGQDALYILRQSLKPSSDPIDLILLDILLPDLSGIEVCRKIRTEEALAHLPIVVLTALSSVDDRLQALTAGADDYLIKPLDHRELVARLEIQFRLRRAEQDARRRIRELVALHTVSEVLNRSLDVQTMLHRTLAVTCDVLRIDAGAVYLVDDERRFARIAASRGMSKAFERHPDIAQVPVGERSVGTVAASGKPIVRPNPKSLPHPTRQIVRDEGLISAAFIPIKNEEAVLGVLSVATRIQRDFHAEETVLLETIGSQLGGALTRARLHQQAQAARDRARSLARRIVQAQEAERQRIARELHDQLGQAATALKLDLELLRDSLGPEAKDLETHLAEDIAIASAMLEEIQTLSLDLRPAVLDDLGLEPAIRWYTDRLAQRTGLAIEVTSEGIGEDYPRLPDEVETVAFRCLQEILTNVIRHAQAQHAEITLARCDDLFALTVADNGIGFDVESVLHQSPSRVALGLGGMRERAALLGGRCRIRSQPGQGTQVIIEIPLGRISGDAP